MMSGPQQFELQAMLETIGFDSINIEREIGGMVFIEAVYGGDEIEAVFNILNSELAYRTYDPYGERWNYWQEV